MTTDGFVKFKLCSHIKVVAHKLTSLSSGDLTVTSPVVGLGWKRADTDLKLYLSGTPSGSVALIINAR